MKRYFVVVAGMVAVALAINTLVTVTDVRAQAFTDVATAAHEGKTGLKSLIAALDANLAMIESGTVKIGIGSGVTNTPGSGCTNFFRVTGTTLVFVTLGQTNVIDADILN